MNMKVEMMLLQAQDPRETEAVERPRAGSHSLQKEPTLQHLGLGLLVS